MREIKFREWVPQGNRFHYWGFVKKGNIVSPIGERHLVKDSEQYTGLKDKNGVEIYEGDIVEYENGNAGYGRPRHEEISRDVIPSITDHDEFVDNAWWWGQGEVIGNIHESPELLGGS